MLSAAHFARIQILNEISFITSGVAHGGPARADELAELRRKLRELDELIAKGEKK